MVWCGLAWYVSFNFFIVLINIIVKLVLSLAQLQSQLVHFECGYTNILSSEHTYLVDYHGQSYSGFKYLNPNPHMGSE